jgi:PAS domain S-box-containing protein
LNRALSALSKCNGALVHASDEAALLQQICEIVVCTGGYRLAWVGYVEQDEGKTVRLVAKSGVDDGYIENAQITWADTERGRGPAGYAIRSGEACILRDIQRDPQFSLWRDEAVQRGYASIISLPLQEGSQTIGALNIYATEADAFDNPEVELLKELAEDLAYGIASMRNATERKRAEEAVLRSEAELRAFVESSPFGIFRTGIEGDRFLSVNRAVVKMLGYDSAAEVLSLSLSKDIYYDAEEREKALAPLLSGESSGAMEARFKRKDGTVVTARWSGRLVQDTSTGGRVLEGIAEDVTESKWTEQALQESEKRFRQVVEGAPVGVYIQTDGVFRYLNPAALAMFGAENASQIVGQEILDRIHPDSRDVVRERVHQVTEEKQAVPFLEQRHLRLDGSTVDVAVTAVPFDYKGRAGGLVFGCDISGRKREEEKRIALEQQLLQAQKMEAVGRLAGGVAHDFNNILMVIQSYTEMVQDRLPVDASLRKYTEQILKAAGRATSLTGQMLAFSRKQITSPVVLDLNSIIDDTAKMLKRLIGEDIEFRVDPGESLWTISADADQVVQILMNLCVNSRDAMPQGGLLTIATENITVENRKMDGCPYVPPGEYVKLSVSDTGMGILKEEQEHIFEPFFTTKEVGKGTGLGLAMVYGIATQNGGYVWVDSEAGQGACFTVCMPRVTRALACGTLPEAEAQPSGTETLLVTEDEQALREAMCDYLRGLGYTVMAASSGAAALAVAREYEGRIDLLITDVVMPKMSGRELAQMLEGLRPELKTIYMSGYTDDAVLRHGIQGMHATFLQKPFSLGILACKVRDMLGQGSTMYNRNDQQQGWPEVRTL